MTQPTDKRTQPSQPVLKPAALRLLREIGQRDTGDGVLFDSAPCGRWRLAGTAYTVADRTFYPLDSAALVNVGNGRTDPVRLTHAGRTHLAALRREGSA
ncbi:hypothetical protein OG787_24500 [Streptomyces sp. NBC_00075]|uniref:hypothetical protein n=1 Tax=Streptomyces sp. NBC_00075 TaxID=2975641 RepID=UPI003256950D